MYLSENFHSSNDATALSYCFFSPDEIVRDCNLSLDEKRELLAGWASDVRSIKDRPAYRLLESGQIVSLDDILTAIIRLDGERRVRSGDLWRDEKNDDEGKSDEIDNDDPDDDPPPVPTGRFIPWPPAAPLISELSF